MNTVEFDAETVLVLSEDGPTVVFIGYADGQPCTCVASAVALRELASRAAAETNDPRTVFELNRQRFEEAARRLLLQRSVGGHAEHDALVVIGSLDLAVLDGEFRSQAP